MSFIREVVYGYYWRKGYSKAQVRNRYQAIRDIVLYNCPLQKAVTFVELQESNVSRILLEKEFCQILNKLGASRYGEVING